MSTRGAIARTAADGFVGVYHHWDSYPRGLGQTLWDLYHTTFEKDLARMLTTVIDEHPAGWSTLNGADWALPVGSTLDKRPDGTEEWWNRPKAPDCYCHGRQESAWTVTEKNAASSGCEWVYAFDEEREHMLVLSSHNEDGSKMIGMFGAGNSEASWSLVADIDLNGTVPDWARIEEEEPSEGHVPS